MSTYVCVGWGDGVCKPARVCMYVQGCPCVCAYAHVQAGETWHWGDTVATSSHNAQPCSGCLCGARAVWGLAPRWEEAWLDVTSHHFFPARWPVHAVFISFSAPS